ncbi:hypothetical protein EON66_06340, partial [archaeon]
THKLLGPLPRNVCEWADSVLKRFPAVFDTKYLCQFNGPPADRTTALVQELSGGASSLGALFASLSGRTLELTVEDVTSATASAARTVEEPTAASMGGATLIMDVPPTPVVGTPAVLSAGAAAAAAKPTAELGTPAVATPVAGGGAARRSTPTLQLALAGAMRIVHEDDDGSEHAHNAAYDAYMTGYVFLRICTLVQASLAAPQHSFAAWQGGMNAALTRGFAFTDFFPSLALRQGITPLHLSEEALPTYMWLSARVNRLHLMRCPRTLCLHDASELYAAGWARLDAPVDAPHKARVSPQNSLLLARKQTSHRNVLVVADFQGLASPQTLPAVIASALGIRATLIDRYALHKHRAPLHRLTRALCMLRTLRRMLQGETRVHVHGKLCICGAAECGTRGVRGASIGGCGEGGSGWPSVGRDGGGE